MSINKCQYGSIIIASIVIMSQKIKFSLENSPRRNILYIYASRCIRILSKLKLAEYSTAETCLRKSIPFIKISPFLRYYYRQLRIDCTYDYFVETSASVFPVCTFLKLINANVNRAIWTTEPIISQIKKDVSRRQLILLTSIIIGSQNRET